MRHATHLSQKENESLRKEKGLESSKGGRLFLKASACFFIASALLFFKKFKSG